MLIIITILIEIDIIMSHITSLPQWAITQCVELDAIGGAIIGLKGKFDWMMIKNKFTSNLRNGINGEFVGSNDGKFCVETNHEKNEELH